MWGKILRQIAADVHAIRLLLEKRDDIKTLGGSISQPTKQEEEKKDADR